MKTWSAVHPRTETRLERHRAEFIQNKCCGPLLKSEELDPDELALVNANFLELVRSRKAEVLEEIYAAYVEVLHSWGVMCPHPQPHRLYDGWQKAMSPIPFDDARWFSCSLCKAAVINR